jgi:hypothetical protein
MLLEGPPYTDARVVYALEHQSTAREKGLRKHLVQELCDLVGVQGRSRHIVPLAGPSGGPSSHAAVAGFNPDQSLP